MKKKSTLFRIDEQVFFTMVGLCVLSLIILGFRYATSETCNPIKIHLPSDTVLVGSRINFKAETRGGQQYTWDFRDGTVKEEETPVVSHTFKTPGKYTISVTVNGSCSEYSTLVVVKPVLKISPITVPVFTGPEMVNLGEPVSFEDTSSLGTSWEWQFEAGGPVEAKGKQATYTFITPGRHLVTVTLNGRVDMFASRFIEVLDDTPEIDKVAKPREGGSRRPRVIEVPSEPSVAPITPAPTPPAPDPEPEPVKKAPMISKPELEKLLEEVAKGRLSAQAFSEYLCGNLDRQVTYNGEVTTFSEMCIKMEKTRDRRVRKISVLITRDEATQCILSLQVTLKKSKI